MYPFVGVRHLKCGVINYRLYRILLFAVYKYIIKHKLIKKAMEENNELSLKKYQTYWDNVEKSLNEGTGSGYKMAILETEKILFLSLGEKRFPGKDIQEKIESAGIFIKNKEKLNYARSMYNKIIKEPGFDVSAEDTREIVSGYYRAISDVVKMDLENLGLKEKTRLLLQRYFYRFPEKARKFLILVFLFFLLVFISAETSTGKSISANVVSFSQFLFYKILPVILAIIAVGIVMVGALYWWQSRRK